MSLDIVVIVVKVVVSILLVIVLNTGSTASSSTYCLLFNRISLSSSPGSLNLIQLTIAITLLIYLFGDLYAHAHSEMSISMLLSPQVVAIEGVAPVVLAVVNEAVIVALAVVGMYCLLAR